MKVILVSPFAEPEKGAASIRIHSFSDCLQQNGFQTEVWAPKRNRVLEQQGVVRYNDISGLVQKLLFRDFDSIVGTSPPLPHNFFLMLICKLKGKPFVLDAKDDAIALLPGSSKSFSKKIKRRIYLLLRRFTYTHAHALLFLTPEDLKLEKKRYGLRQPCLVLYNGADLRVFNRSTALGKQKRKELGIPENALVLMYAGSTEDEEIEEFLQTVRPFALKKNVWILLLLLRDESVYKDGALEPIQQAVQEMGLGEKTRIQYNISYQQLNPFFSCADIAILPWPNNLPTSLPVKIFDYGAAQLPLLVKGPENSSISKLFNEFEIGFFSPDWNGFYKKLEQMEASESLRQKMGTNARKMVEERFVRAKNNPLLVELLKTLANKKKQ